MARDTEEDREGEEKGKERERYRVTNFMSVNIQYLNR